MPDPAFDAMADAGADALRSTRTLTDVRELARAVLETAGVPALLPDLAVERAGAVVGQRNRNDLQAEVDRLNAERQRVRELHSPYVRTIHPPHSADCIGCSEGLELTEDWPCTTALIVYTAEEIAAVPGPEGVA